MTRSRFLLVTAVLAAGLSASPDLLATQPQLAPRGTFTNIMTVPALTLGDCGPNGVYELNEGIDGNGPFFSFQWETMNFVYRPRACSTCAVSHWGDGRMTAVRIFREQFERLKRSTDPQVFLPPGPPYGVPNCQSVILSGTGKSCRGAGGCLIPLTFSPDHYMTGPSGPGLGGALLEMVVDPATQCFEDYRFRYSVFN